MGTRWQCHCHSPNPYPTLPYASSGLPHPPPVARLPISIHPNQPPNAIYSFYACILEQCIFATQKRHLVLLCVHFGAMHFRHPNQQKIMPFTCYLREINLLFKPLLQTKFQTDFPNQKAFKMVRVHSWIERPINLLKVPKT